MSEIPVLTDSALAIDAMARSKYEAFDSHFSMPGGLSWEAYKADDPDGAAMYVGDASDDLAALLASGAVRPAAEVRAEGAQEWRPRNGTVEDDLRSRLLCVLEATYWDRPYDERIAAIRGMCDLTTNGMTPLDRATPVVEREIAAARAEALREAADKYPGGWLTGPHPSAWMRERADQIERAQLTGMDERLAKVAEVLREHQRGEWREVKAATKSTEALYGAFCTCGVMLDARDRDGTLRLHLADTLAPLLGECQAADEARALREAADEIEAWADRHKRASLTDDEVADFSAALDALRDRAVLAAADRAEQL